MSKKTKNASGPDKAGQIGTRQAAWQDLVVLCRKCSGKLKGGYGEKGRDSLRDVLRDGLREAGRKRDIRIIETGCLGVCPKGAVVAIRGSESNRILIVHEGQTADSVLQTFGIIRQGPPG